AGDDKGATAAIEALVDGEAGLVQQPFNSERAGVACRSELEDEDAIGADLPPDAEQALQVELVAGVGDDDRIRLFVRAAFARTHIADLVVAVPAEPEQRREGARAGDSDDAGFGNADTFEEVGKGDGL